MKFCPKCNSFCITDYSKKQAVCNKCGHAVDLENPKELIYKKLVEEKIVVMTENLRSLISLPRVRRKCPKCGNNEAYVSVVASRSEEDYEEELNRCIECNYKWRTGN
ncbi:MAG: hypothetical protein ACXAB2_13925 [Candidatus Hodarchaeales archaeon]|jgi:DNA-directed RNA polymerase subunit M